jgi:hypothetical protein
VSTLLGQARARAFKPIGSLPRPRLTIVPKVAAKAPRVPFVLLVVTVLVGGLVGLLLLNTALQRGAYTVGSLRDTSAALDQQKQSLELRVAALQQPQHVLHAAQKLGMVWTDSPAFISLANGKITGDPNPGSRANRVDLGATVGGTGPHDKTRELLAGSHNSLGSGAVVVEKPAKHAKGPTGDNTLH